MKKLLLLSACALCVTSASALEYGFERITDNASQDLASQFSVNVLDNSTTVSFVVKNNVGIASTIATVYFDGTVGVLGNPTIQVTSGSSPVVFASGGSPANPPGGASLSFTSDNTFGAGTPPPHRGLNEAADSLTLTFGYEASYDFDYIIGLLDSGNLRIGLHVIAIGEDSDSFVNTRPDPVSVPDGGTTLCLMGLGLLGLGAASRRRA